MVGFEARTRGSPSPGPLPIAMGRGPGEGLPLDQLMDGLAAGVGNGVFAGGLGVEQAVASSRPAATATSRPRRPVRTTGDRNEESAMKDTSFKPPRQIATPRRPDMRRGPRTTGRATQRKD